MGDSPPIKRIAMATAVKGLVEENPRIEIVLIISYVIEEFSSK